MAKKYYGIQETIEKTVKLDNRAGFKVTDTMADMPINTHFPSTIQSYLPKKQVLLKKKFIKNFHS